MMHQQRHRSAAPRLSRGPEYDPNKNCLAAYMLPMAQIRRLLHSPQRAPNAPRLTLQRVPSKPSSELLPHSEVRRLLHGDLHPAKRHCGTGSVCAALATRSSVPGPVSLSADMSPLALRPRAPTHAKKSIALQKMTYLSGASKPASQPRTLMCVHGVSRA